LLRKREIIRVRECKDCDHRFITKEIPMDKATELGHITVTDTAGVTTMYCSSGYRKKYTNRGFIDG
jgi:transcriptional regulator NrdR family protein